MAAAEEGTLATTAAEAEASGGKEEARGATVSGKHGAGANELAEGTGVSTTVEAEPRAEASQAKICWLDS